MRKKNLLYIDHDPRYQADFKAEITANFDVDFDSATNKNQAIDKCKEKAYSLIVIEPMRWESLPIRGTLR